MTISKTEVSVAIKMNGHGWETHHSLLQTLSQEKKISCFRGTCPYEKTNGQSREYLSQPTWLSWSASVHCAPDLTPSSPSHILPPRTCVTLHLDCLKPHSSPSPALSLHTDRSISGYLLASLVSQKDYTRTHLTSDDPKLIWVLKIENTKDKCTERSK